MKKKLKQELQSDGMPSTNQNPEIKLHNTDATSTDPRLDDVGKTPEESLKVRVARYYSSI